MKQEMVATYPIVSSGLKKKHPLWAVVEWEVRRQGMQRGPWLFAGGLFLVIAGLYGLTYGNQSQINIMYINGTRIMWGSHGVTDRLVESITLPFAAWSLFGLLVIGFEALKVAMGVLSVGLLARDRQVRIHEILMASTLPTWAYVWGRWLGGVILFGTFSMVPLVAVLSAGWALYLINPGSNPPPNTLALVQLWSLLAAVDVLLISAIGLSLGTWAWRWRTVVASGLGLLSMLGPQWILLLPENTMRALTWVPNHLALLSSIETQYDMRKEVLLAPYTTVPSEDILAAIWRAVFAQPPDLTPWLGQLGYAGLGIALVTILAWRFRRSQI